jgi:tRNA pseudouridine38-40 synthase
MPRYLLRLEYLGTDFHGFQKQPGLETVQGALESALMVFSGAEPRVQGAGRTDTGVHALGQAAAFDLERELDPDQVQGSLNGLLPPAISITSVRIVREDLDPRRGALWREYRYFILNRRSPSALLRGFTHHVSAPLDFDSMAAACGLFVGEHDFGAFRIKGGPDEPGVRTVYECEISRPLPDVVCFRVRANAFLYRMVRIMAGAVVSAGCARMEGDDISRALLGAGGPCAEALPACGLFLWHVAYPDDIYVDVEGRGC